MSSQSKWMNSSSEDTNLVITNGTCEAETMVALHCTENSGGASAEGDHLAISSDGLPIFCNNDLSLPEVCISTNSNNFEEDMNYEVQQAYKIFTGFLIDKHKGITSPFLHPISCQESQHGVEGVRSWGQAQLRKSMCIQRMKEKFINQEYESITEFVADFRLMLENYYRYHGVDHCISKQAQKLEIMLEQKLTLLSRTLREKTTLAMTSKGRFGIEEERSSGTTSSRRRLAPRSLATITVGGHESIMVQTLRLEEQQRARDEKRQRELEKKEAEEMLAKEVEEWEHKLLLQASPNCVETLWELPAIGHFLCLAQAALNLPEIIFFELERCLLMPRCSMLLSKIMSSLLFPPQRRATLHRRTALPYRRWESELRQRVMVWYQTVGASHNQPRRAEQLGLCHKFFSTLGVVSPLEEKPFHLLSFFQRVWLLKGLCDHVYETQREVQNALLSQPIHECRESILGYDSKENAYIHFPHFCGTDLRIYCQSPSSPPPFPFPSVWVKRVQVAPETEDDDLDGLRDELEKCDRRCSGSTKDTGESDDFEKGGTTTPCVFKGGNWDGLVVNENITSWSLKNEEGSELGYSGGESCGYSEIDLKTCTNSSLSHTHSPFGGMNVEIHLKEETVELKHQSRQLALKQEQGFAMGSMCTIGALTPETCLSVSEHSYTGRSPACSVHQTSQTKSQSLKMEVENLSQGHQKLPCLECRKSNAHDINSDERDCCCGTSGAATQLSSESAPDSTEERMNNLIWTKNKKWKKSHGQEELLGVKGEHKQLQHVDRMRLCPAENDTSVVQRVPSMIKRKDKKKKHKTGKKLESTNNHKDESPIESSFKLICTSLEELRQLISQTEDELDDLESAKKRLGRWYYRREAVKDLHSTLIRLLNELSPWEPKLIKAFQRNRLRLKKEFDDFKTHPEYAKFVREERISSSSSDEDDEEGSLGKEMCAVSDFYRRTEEDLEHMVPKGLWSGSSTREFVAESFGERMLTLVPPSHLKHPPASTEEVSQLQQDQTGSSNITSNIDSQPQSRSKLIPSNQFRISNSAWASGAPAKFSQSPRVPILHPTTGLPKGYTPIPTLLAKSVGNKVTLIKCPAGCPGVSNRDKQSIGSLVSLPASAVTNTKPSKVPSLQSISQKNNQQQQVQGLKQTEILKQNLSNTVTAALSKSHPAKQTQNVQINPAQMVCKEPERLCHVFGTHSGRAVRVHPAMDQNTREKTLKHVVILPSDLPIHKTEELVSSSHQQFKGIQDPVSKVTSPICMSTNVPGFTIPENSIPVQQVVPLKYARTVRNPSPSVSPPLQQGSKIPAELRSKDCSPQASTTQSVKLHTLPITSCAVSTEPIKSAGPKQELKTICIRDSQSILVTTRGGNTGIVKVQTSSNHNVLGSLAPNPVINISPQFKAFLVSKTSQPGSPSYPSPTSSYTAPAIGNISMAKAQNQISSALQSPSSVTSPILTAVHGNIPVRGPGNQAASIAVALSQGSNNSAGSTVETKTCQQAQTAGDVAHFQASLVKNTVVAPPLSSVPHVLTQSDVISKTGVKRTNTDERSSQFTKFFLVTPSSSPASNVDSSKGAFFSAKSLPTSRFKFISQPSSSSCTSFEKIPKHAVPTGASGKLLTSSLSSQTPKMGLSLGQPVGVVNSELLSKVKNFTLPSGVQLQLSGKTTTIGQTIGALTCSSSKNTPVSVLDTRHPTATTTGVVLVTSSNHTIASYSDPVSSYASITSSSQLQGIPSSTKLIQAGSLSFPSPSTTLNAAHEIKEDFRIAPNILSSMSSTQMTSTLQNGPVQTSTSTYVHRPSNIQSRIGKETPMFSPPFQSATNKPHISTSSAASTNVQSTSSGTGTIQQRIVINTSTPLAAGTQILLNNARFVVPPQGLGPGSHILIISSPPPQQVPTNSFPSTVASVPSHRGSVVTVAPGISVLSQSPTGLPSEPTGSTGLGSTVLPNTKVVSALPGMPAPQASSFASPTVGAPTLVSSLPSFGKVSALVSSWGNSANALSSSLSTITLPAGAPVAAECSSNISPAVAQSLSNFLSPLSSLPVLPNQSTPTSISSAVAPVVAGTTALHSSLPAQQVVSTTSSGLVIPPQQTIRGFAAPSTTLSQTLVHTVQDNIADLKTLTAVMQPVLAGTQTHVLPTVADSPIVSKGSRILTLPIATVTPMESIVNTFERSAVVTVPSCSISGPNNPAQPVTTVKVNNSIHLDVLTNQALGKHSLQTSFFGMPTNLASNLLISPEGAVLNTVQCQDNTEKTACPKPVETD